MKTTAEKQLLLNIQADVLALRQELGYLRSSLELAGLIAGEQPGERKPVAVKWTPPVLKKLGDMITIIAESNPATAALLQQKANPRDPEFDPTLDHTDDDATTDQDASTDGDPTPRDWFNTGWFGGVKDPTPANKKRDHKADPKPPRKDDDNNVNFLPDTEGPKDITTDPTA